MFRPQAIIIVGNICKSCFDFFSLGVYQTIGPLNINIWIIPNCMGFLAASVCTRFTGLFRPLLK